MQCQNYVWNDTQLSLEGFSNSLLFCITLIIVVLQGMIYMYMIKTSHVT